MKKRHHDADIIIDRTMNITGDITFKGSALVEGRIKGNVTGRKIFLTETGTIDGHLVMEEVVCHGRITGSITSKSLKIASRAQVKGQIDYTVLEVGSSAVMECDIKHSNSNLHYQKNEVDDSIFLVEEDTEKSNIDHTVEDTEEDVEEDTVEDIIEDTEEDIIEEVKEDVEEDIEEEMIKEIAVDEITVQAKQEEVFEQVTEVEEKVVESPTISAPVPIETLQLSGFFTEGARKQIILSIIEAMETSKGMIKVVGDLGSGKTTICQKLCDLLSRNFKVVKPDNVVGSTKDLFVQITKALDVEVDDISSQNDIVEKLKEHFTNNLQAKPVVLVLDNCHEMYPATLEGVIKKLGRSITTNEELMQLVLFGDGFLDKQLDPKAADHFFQNPECAFTLEPLSKDETNTYVEFKLGEIQKCMNSDLPFDFPDESVDKVYTLSHGVIGKIDRIVELSIELAGTKKKSKVVPKFVKNI